MYLHTYTRTYLEQWYFQAVAEQQIKHFAANAATAYNYFAL